ncbi:hypothetical protein AALO_G00273120, partial [Alosa alosa]
KPIRTRSQTGSPIEETVELSCSDSSVLGSDTLEVACDGLPSEPSSQTETGQSGDLPCSMTEDTTLEDSDVDRAMALLRAQHSATSLALLTSPHSLALLTTLSSPHHTPWLSSP